MKENEPNIESAGLIAFILIVLFLFFSSCATLEKTTRYFDQHVDEAANYCANTFPVKDSQVIYLPGVPVFISDTTYLPADSVPCPDQKDGEVGKSYVKCPPGKII